MLFLSFLLVTKFLLFPRDPVPCASGTIHPLSRNTWTSPGQADTAYCLLPTSSQVDSGKESKLGQTSLVLLLEQWQKRHSLFSEIHSCEDDGSVTLMATSARYWGGDCLRMKLTELSRIKRWREWRIMAWCFLEHLDTPMPEVHANTDMLVIKSRH